MLYVLKYIGLGPGDFLEHFYDEVVPVKNYIALVQMEHNKEQLLGRNFQELGMIESEENLKDLIKDKSTELTMTTKTVSLKPKKDQPIEGAQKSWYENLE